MTRADFTNATDRYCQRLVRVNTKPERVSQIRSTLRDFLREIERDMASDPTLFEDAGWGVPNGPGCLEHNITTVARLMSPDVVRIRYEFGTEWTGEPALFVRVLLSDAASAPDRLSETTERVQDKIQIALAASGVKEFAYFNYRSEGERKTMAHSGDWKDWE